MEPRYIVMFRKISPSNSQWHSYQIFATFEEASIKYNLLCGYDLEVQLCELIPRVAAYDVQLVTEPDPAELAVERANDAWAERNYRD